jgi:hypothetical protein
MCRGPDDPGQSSKSLRHRASQILRGVRTVPQCHRERGQGLSGVPDQGVTRWLGDALEGGYQQPPIEPNRSAMAESPVC